MRAHAPGRNKLVQGVIAGVVCAAGGVAHAQLEPFGGGQEEEKPHVRLSLVSDHDSIEPGQRFQLGVSFEIDAGWHIYWHGENDTGFAPAFEIEAPAGFEVGEALWPAPHRHISPGEILDHTYEDRVTLIVPMTAPTDLQSGREIEFRVESDWLVCEAVCIPEDGEATLRVRTGEARSSGKKTLRLFEESRRRIPEPAPGSVWGSERGEAPFRIRESETKPGFMITAPGADRLRYFPADDSAKITNLIEGGERAGGQLTLYLEDAGAFAGVAGVVEVVRGGESAFYTIPRRDRGGEGAQD